MFLVQISLCCTLQAQDQETLLPCLANYAVEAGRVCDALDSKDKLPASSRLAVEREEEKQSCANAALLLSQLQPPTAASVQCRAAQNPRDSCLWRYHMRYEHRYLRMSPVYGDGRARLHRAGALDALQQSMSDR
jgi:hypothetical protein